MYNSFAAPQAKGKAANDIIFAANALAVADAAAIGAENVTNGTIGAILDDDSKLVTPVVHLLRVRIVRESDEVASQLLYDGELLVVVAVGERVGLPFQVVVHADAPQLVWLPIEQESRV